MNEHWINSNNGERERSKMVKESKMVQSVVRSINRSVGRSVGWWSDRFHCKMTSKSKPNQSETERATTVKRTHWKMKWKSDKMPKLVSTNFLIGITEWNTNHIRMRDKSLNAMYNCTLTSSKVVASSMPMTSNSLVHGCCFFV